MRRLAISYLTICVVLILLANLALIILYVRQFSLNALNICVTDNCQQPNVLGDFVAVNAVLAGVLLIIWFAITKFHFHQHGRES